MHCTCLLQVAGLLDGEYGADIQRVSRVCLPNRSLNVRQVQGAVCVVSGPSGSGKSTLLAAVLGELLRTAGLCTVNGTCALAPQEPWLLGASVRQNVIMGRPFDDERYEQVRTLLCGEPHVSPLLGQHGQADRVDHSATLLRQRATIRTLCRC